MGGREEGEQPPPPFRTITAWSYWNRASSFVAQASGHPLPSPGATAGSATGRCLSTFGLLSHPRTPPPLFLPSKQIAGLISSPNTPPIIPLASTTISPSFRGSKVHRPTRAPDPSPSFPGTQLPSDPQRFQMHKSSRPTEEMEQNLHNCRRVAIFHFKNYK